MHKVQFPIWFISLSGSTYYLSIAMTFGMLQNPAFF